MTACGERKAIDGGTPLVCNLAAGHALPHGVRHQPHLPPYVVWPVAYRPSPVQVAERVAWRKPHVRRQYQTLGMWKAANL